MKNKGIVKIDEVGRIVIPKDVRQMLNLNDKLVRVYVDDDRVIIKKYAPVLLYKDLLFCICNELEKQTGYPCIIGNMQVIMQASSDSLSFLKGKSISSDFKKLIHQQKNTAINIDNGYDAIQIAEGVDLEYHALCQVPVKDEFSLIGFFALIALTPARLGEKELNALNIAKNIFLTVIKSQK